MTAEPQGAPPDGRAATEYTERLATRISRDVRRRLRLTAAITGRSISETLDGALARALPTDRQLADGLCPAPKTAATIRLILSGEHAPEPGSFWDQPREALSAELARLESLPPTAVRADEF
jgi:hypothetical protein